MGIFGSKDPMEKWRKRNSSMAALVDRTGWQVDLSLGVVTTVVNGIPITVILSPPMTVSYGGTGVLIEAGRQAEATLANRFDNVVNGERFEVCGWEGVAEHGNGLIDGQFNGPDQELVDGVIAAVEDLAARVQAS